MNIAAIRLAIDGLFWSISDLRGHTRDEFIKRDVRQVLMSRIEYLESIEIKPRFERDAERRKRAIDSAMSMIERWESMRTISPVTVANHELRLEADRMLADPAGTVVDLMAWRSSRAGKYST